MDSNHDIGKAGQKAAETFLLKKGYQIITRNFRKNTGEIDLVARDGDYVVFVEVKARKGLEYGLPREAVGRAKQKRIVNMALRYMAQHNITETDIRFDVVEVLMHQGQVYVSHIENAFTG